MTRILTIAAIALLGACSPMIWDKEGATQLDFNKDDYRCRQEAQTGVVITNVYYGGGVSGAYGRATGDRAMYQRCMAASGYSLRGS